MTPKNLGPSPGTAPPPLAPPESGNTTLLLTYASAGLTALLGPGKNTPGIRFHGFHALFTVIAMFATHTMLGMLGGNFQSLQSLFDLAAGGFTVFQLYRAYNGQPFEIPVLGAMARKQAESAAHNANHTVQ